MTSADSFNLDNNTDDHVEQSTSTFPPPGYLRHEQRIQMTELSRNTESDTTMPIPLDAFGTHIEENIDVQRALISSTDEDISDNGGLQSASPFKCLFCSQSFSESDEGFTTNLEHMRTTHDIFIPDPEMVTDMQSLVGYLATEIRTWHECLYCGATKSSIRSIQSHMRDKGHCLLNLDREPELRDFWESTQWSDGDRVEDEPEQESPTKLSTTEIRFASGKVISSRDTPPATRRVHRRQSLRASTTRALPTSSEDGSSSSVAVKPQLASSRQMARREEMSILGLSTQQRQGLVLAEKKAQRSEAVARRAREWAYAKGANSQKFDQADNQMKWGKQNHKLQPR